MAPVALRKAAPLALGKAEKSTLQAHAYTKLRQAIMAGTLIPGQSTSIRSLAAALGTSHIPVREALMRLAAERALAILPNGSVAVPAMNRSRFEDIRRTRVAIEGFAVELAADKLSEVDFRKMEAAYLKREAALKGKNFRDAMQHGQHSRFVVYYATRSETLIPIIESLWLQVGPFFNLAHVERSQVASTQNQRKAIDALRRGDGRGARTLVEQDIMTVGDLVLAHLPEDHEEI
jgi:DNA-binding GntR family transcriptional regulator